MKSRTGSGIISACGGSGFAGGGGGRVSVDIFSRHDEPQIFVHGKYVLLIQCSTLANILNNKLICQLQLQIPFFSPSILFSLISSGYSSVTDEDNKCK